MLDEYQITQDLYYQDYLNKELKEKNAVLEKNIAGMIKDANCEIDALNVKITCKRIYSSLQMIMTHNAC